MTETDPLVQLLKLAAQETATAGYREITPAHLLIALSRASEDDTSGIPTAISGALRSEFEHLGLEPQRFRRRLRKLLGNAGVQQIGTVVHRSPACRAVFAAAQQFAHEAKEPFDARHLVRAAVQRIIDAQSERTRHQLSEHRHTLDRIVEALGERNRLLKDELLALLTAEEQQLPMGPTL